MVERTGGAGSRRTRYPAILMPKRAGRPVYKRSRVREPDIAGVAGQGRYSLVGSEIPRFRELTIDKVPDSALCTNNAAIGIVVGRSLLDAQSAD